MITRTKKDLVHQVATKAGLHPAQVQDVIQYFLDAMSEELAQGNRLEFRDFGVFEVVMRKAKVGRNPKQANVAIVIPARKAVKFTPGKKMKEFVEEPAKERAWAYASAKGHHSHS